MDGALGGFMSVIQVVEYIIKVVRVITRRADPKDQQVRPLDSKEWARRIPLVVRGSPRYARSWSIPLCANSGKARQNGDHGWISHDGIVAFSNDQEDGWICLSMFEAADRSEVGERKNPPPAKSGFAALSEQWKGGSQDVHFMAANSFFGNQSTQWYRMESYELLMAKVQDPHACETQPVADHKGVEVGVAQVIRYVCISEVLHEDKALKRRVDIDCHSFITPKTRTIIDSNDGLLECYTSEPFIAQLKYLDPLYDLVKTKGTWKQAILLQIHHSSLILFANFLSTLSPGYLANQQETFDTAWAALRQWNLQQLTADSHQYLVLSEMASELTTTAESLTKVLRASIPETSPEATLTLSKLEADLHGIAKELTTRLHNLSTRTEHDLRALEQTTTMKQNLGVQNLSLLATIFLPLSVATGLLSMSTRFRALGPILYDFFGVVVLLGIIALLLLLVLQLLAWAREKETKLVQNAIYRSFIRPGLQRSMAIIALLYIGLVLASFCVGMFRDVALGARILGWGTLAGTLLVAVPVFLGGVVLLGLLVTTKTRPAEAFENLMGWVGAWLRRQEEEGERRRREKEEAGHW